MIATDQSVAWSVSADESWVTITSGATGNGNGTFNYSVAGNPAATSRTSTVTVKPSSGNTPTFVITQLGGILSISPSSANVEATGRSGTVTVNTDDPSLEWTASSNEAWVTITSGSSGIGPGSVQWTAMPNQSINARTAIISVVPLNGVGQTFPISQPGGSGGGTISLSPSSLSLDATAKTGAIQVIATNQSLTWSAVSNQSWFAISGASGTGSGSISYSATANPSTISRTATVTVTPNGAPVVTLEVTQLGGVLTVSPSSANVIYSGGAGSITLTTTDGALPWTATSNQTWLTVTSGGSGTGSGMVQWSASANTTNVARTGTISITPAGGAAQNVNVNQDAAPVTGSISLSPSSLNVPASISNGAVQVISTNPALSWTAASSDTSWLTITSGASGTGNGSFSYAAAGNPAAAPRTATITVTPASGTAPTLTVTQSAAAMTVSPASANVQGSGGTGSFGISTNTPTLRWTATSDSTWLTITSAASGTANATMNWSAASNSGTTPRTGTIAITPLGGTQQTFTVTEAGLTQTIVAVPSTLSFSYQQLGSLPAAAQITVTGGGSGLAFTTNATSTGGWLTVSPGAITPAVVNVSVNPGTLAVGTYTGSVSIASPAATNSPVTIPVTLTITSAPVLTAQPNAVSFSYQQNGPLPANKSVSLSSTVPLSYSIVQDASASWLFASGPGTSPSTMTVSVNPAGLQPGNYQGTITVLASAAGNSPLTVPVSLTVSAAPSLIATPSSLSVNYRQSDPNPAPIDFSVASSDGSLPYLADISPSTPWLSIVEIARPGQTAQTPSSIRLGIDPSGLSPGTYQGAVILTSIAAGNNPLIVPVTLIVTAAATLTAAPSRLSFGATQGTSTSQAQTVSLSSDSLVNFTATASTTSTVNWLSVLASNAATPASLAVVVQSGTLTIGTYNGTITVTSAQAGNSPLTIPVTLTISPQPQLTVTPAQLSFHYQLLSGSAPAQQSLVISSSMGNGAEVSATVSTSTGGNWLSTSGGISTPGVIEIIVDPTGLTAGVYTGSVTLTSTGYASTIVPVTLRVTAAPVFVVHPTSLDFAYQTGSTPPASQTISISSSSTDFGFSAAPSSGAPWLDVVGGGTTAASVSVTVHPAGLLPGTYTASVILSSSQAGNSPLLIPVHLTVTAGVVIRAQPTAVSFTYTQQGNVPDSQSLSISSSSPQQSSIDFTSTISPAESWLVLSGSGPTPASLQVTVNPSGLTPGVYNASIIISAAAAANTPLIVPVTLTVKAAPTISPSASQFVFSYQLQGEAPANQVLTVTGSDPSLVVTATAATDTGSWLTIVGGGSVPSSFSITTNPAGLSAGTYNGTITLSAPNAGNSPLEIPVVLVISAAPVLRAAPGALTFSYVVGDPNPASATVQTSSSGTPITYDVTAGTASGGPWLDASNGGATPGSFSATVTPVGLAPGSYSGTISLSSSTAGNSPLQIPVTLTVVTTTALSAAPASVALAAQQGLAATQQQLVHISSGNTTIAVTYNKSPGADWLIVTGPGSTPGDLSISASAANLIPGRYSASVLVMSLFASNSPLIIPVTFDVSAAPVFQTAPATLQFSFTVGGTKPGPQSLAIMSSGTPLDFSTSVLPGAPWLFSSGTGTTPGSVSVSVDPGVVAVGVHTGTVVIVSPSSPTTTVNVPVILTVSSAPLLSAEPQSQSFSYQIGGQIPLARTLVVSSSDNSAIPVSASASTLDQGNWLSVAIVQGTTPAAAIASVSPANLTAGTYNGSLQFTSPNAGNSPLTVPITLTVSTAPTINTTQSRFLFSYQVGGSPPANQQVTLSSSDGSALPVSAVVSNSFSAITASLDSSTTPALLTVSVSPGSLSPGVYQSSVVVSSALAGNSPLIIPVILTISPQPVLTATPSTATFAYQIGGPLPPSTSVTINSSGDPLNFTVSLIRGGSWLIVSGGGATPSPVQISVNPVGLVPGLYNAIIVVSSSAAGNNPLQIAVLLTVSPSPLLTASPTSPRICRGIADAKWIADLDHWEYGHSFSFHYLDFFVDALANRQRKWHNTTRCFGIGECSRSLAGNISGNGADHIGGRF